jgi:hypothetical protein
MHMKGIALNMKTNVAVANSIKAMPDYALYP